MYKQVIISFHSVPSLRPGVPQALLLKRAQRQVPLHPDVSRHANLRCDLLPGQGEAERKEQVGAEVAGNQQEQHHAHR